MSNPDDYVDDFDEWEVVNVKKSPELKAIKTKPKKKPIANKEDVQLLQRKIEEQLNFKHLQDEQNLIDLRDNINQQKQISEYQLNQIQQQLNRITQMQIQQTENQKKQTLKQMEMQKHQKNLSQKLSEVHTQQSIFQQIPSFFQKNTIHNPGMKEEPKILNPNSNELETEFDFDEIVDEEKTENVWVCPVCNDRNEESNKFCPKCGCKNDLFNGLNTKFLKYKSSVNFKPLQVGESTNCGWVLNNNTSSVLNIHSNLLCIKNDPNAVGLKVKPEKKLYNVTLKSKEEIYILLDITAPVVPGKYSLKYQLVDKNNNYEISDVLELVLDVKPKFDKKKESMIEQIAKMGFEMGRKQIEKVLISQNWDVQQAIGVILQSNN